MRDLPVIVVRDDTASNTTEENDFALQQMERVLGAKVLDATGLDLHRFIRPSQQQRPAG